MNTKNLKKGALSLDVARSYAGAYFLQSGIDRTGCQHSPIDSFANFIFERGIILRQWNFWTRVTLLLLSATLAPIVYTAFINPERSWFADQVAGRIMVVAGSWLVASVVKVFLIFFNQDFAHARKLGKELDQFARVFGGYKILRGSVGELERRVLGVLVGIRHCEEAGIRQGFDLRTAADIAMKFVQVTPDELYKRIHAEIAGIAQSRMSATNLPPRPTYR